MTLQALEGVDQPCGCHPVIKVAPLDSRLDTHTHTQTAITTVATKEEKRRTLLHTVAAPTAHCHYLLLVETVIIMLTQSNNSVKLSNNISNIDGWRPLHLALSDPPSRCVFGHHVGSSTPLLASLIVSSTARWMSG